MCVCEEVSLVGVYICRGGGWGSVGGEEASLGVRVFVVVGTVGFDVVVFGIFVYYLFRF